jgi:uncharacterized membrane protein
VACYGGIGTTGGRSDMDYNHAVQRVGEVIDAAGVAIMFAGAAIAAVNATIRLARHDIATYRRFRQQLGQAILLGLELLVAGDIVRTVAAEPSLNSIAVLAGIVLIRTFLSFSLEVELTGRWPWQSRTSLLPPGEPTPSRRPGLRARDGPPTLLTRGAGGGGGGGRLEEHPAGPDRGCGLPRAVAQLGQDGARRGAGDLDAVLAETALEGRQGRTADRAAEAPAETGRGVLGACLERGRVTAGQGWARTR